MKKWFEHTPLLSGLTAGAMLWIAFVVLVLGLLIFDLRRVHKSVSHHRRHSTRTLVTISCAFMYGLLVCLLQDHINGFIFFSAYPTEYAHSIDNLFAFAIIFYYFRLPEKHQSSVLLWGIFGAIIFRFVFVFVGGELLERFNWLLYGLAVFLLWSGAKMLLRKEEKAFQPAKSWISGVVVRFLPVAAQTHPETFLLREQNKTKLTSLFVALLFVAFTDILFALDSLPAAFGMTRNKTLILTSTILAVMGLRSLFFLLSDFLNRFAYLQKAVPLLLIFFAFKMMADLLGFAMVPVYSFLVISMVLSGGVVRSVLRNKKAAGKIKSFQASYALHNKEA